MSNDHGRTLSQTENLQVDRTKPTNATTRLQKELCSLMVNPPKGISAFPESDFIYKWVATIQGVDGTPYEGQTYKLRLTFNDTYPFNAPSVVFSTPIFHPNVEDKSGIICLDILKEQWSATYDIRALLLSIQSLMGDPNVRSPLNVEAANLWPRTSLFTQTSKEFYAKHNKK